VTVRLFDTSLHVHVSCFATRGIARKRKPGLARELTNHSPTSPVHSSSAQPIIMMAASKARSLMPPASSEWYLVNGITKIAPTERPLNAGSVSFSSVSSTGETPS